MSKCQWEQSWLSNGVTNLDLDGSWTWGHTAAAQPRLGWDQTLATSAASRPFLSFYVRLQTVCRPSHLLHRAAKKKKKKKRKISVSKLIMTGCNFYSGWDEHYLSHTFMSEVGEVSGNSRECIQVVQYMVSGGNWDRWRRRRHLWTVFTGFFPVQDVSFLCLFQLDPWCQTQLMFFLQVFLGLACGVLDSAAYYKQTWVCKAFVIIQDSQALMSSGLFVHLAVDNLQISLQLNSCRSECFVIALTSFWSGGSLCRVLSVEFIDPNQP